MIHEDDLRRLLADAAEAVPPPGRAPEALLSALVEQEAPRRRPHAPRAPRVRLVALAAAVVVVAALGAALVKDDPKDTFTATGAAIGSADEGGDGSGSQFGRLSGGSTADAVAGGAGGGTASGSAEVAPVAPVRARPGLDSAKVVKTGSLDLEVREGAFDGVVDRITARTVGLGGYIAESTTNESSDTPSGSLVVRVPAESFEPLIAELRKLGDVKGVSSKGTDVTAQLTDLAARLSALSATRDRLSAVLAEARNVPDILAVQDRITAVQTEIEQIQGQQRLLEDQTSFATLAVTVGEPGSEIIETRANEGLGKAWDDARRRFGDSLERIVSWSGSAAVFALVGLVLLVLGRLLWVAVRRRMV